MNDNTENRIRLAEWRGWKRVTLKTFGGDDSNVWESPEGVQRANSLPDPLTDANDCEALIRHLNSLDYGLTIEPWPDSHTVALYAHASSDDPDEDDDGMIADFTELQRLTGRTQPKLRN